MNDNDPTPSLSEFLLRYEADASIWWSLGSGHHLNLFDAACERIKELERWPRDGGETRVDGTLHNLGWKHDSAINGPIPGDSANQASADESQSLQQAETQEGRVLRDSDIVRLCTRNRPAHLSEPGGGAVGG